MTAEASPRLQTGTFIKGRRVDLSWHLGQALASVETLFGPRDHSWTVLGLEIGKNDYPQIFFPSSAPNHIRVHLGSSVATEIQACYQIGHEVVHLLDPIRSLVGSVLEEGLATWHSDVFSRACNPEYPADCGHPSYKRALDLAAPVISNPELLRTWREQHPGRGFSAITAFELHALYPELAPDAAAALAEPFNR